MWLLKYFLGIIFVDLRGLRGFFPPMFCCVSDMLNAVLQLSFSHMYHFFHVVTSEMIGLTVFSPWLCYIHLIKTWSHFEHVDVSHENVAFITSVEAVFT
jgi:hypothetical protein